MVIQKNRWPYIVPAFYVTTFEGLDSYHQMFKQNGYEGSVVIRPVCPYKDGKFSTKMKRKDFKDGEFKIIGGEIGSGKHLHRLGALHLQANNGSQFSVGTGFSDKQREEYWEHLMQLLGKKATIRYQELSEDGIPLITSFVSIRDYE